MALLIPSMQLLSPFLGRFVDAFGPKITAYCQESLGVLGISILIVAVKTLADPLLYVGFAAMSLSTWLGSLLIVQIGLYFKGHTISRVIFILNNVFSSGAIVFLFLWLISKSFSESSNAAAITLGGYLVFALLLYGISAYFWSVTKPALSEDELSVFVSTRSLVSSRESFQISHRFSVSSAVLLGGLDASRHGGSGQLSRRISSEKSFRKSLSHQPTQKTGDNISERLESALDTLDLAPADTSPGKREYISVADRKPEDQLLSIPFLCHCIFFGLHVAMCNWNTATQKDFLEDLGDDEADNLYLTIFTLLAPASVLGSPFIDKAILKFGWTAALHSVNVLAVAYMTVKVASTSLDVQILGFIIFMFYRSFLFGISFSFVPVLMNATVVGRAAGAMAGCAGLASCMAIPLIRLALKSDGGFLVPNAVLLSLCLPTTAAVCVVSHYLQLEIAAKEVAEEDPKAATA